MQTSGPLVLPPLKWGVFRLAPKQGKVVGGNQGEHGGWEADCPFHVKARHASGGKSGCRHFVAVKGPEVKQSVCVCVLCLFARACVCAATALVYKPSCAMLFIIEIALFP
eukprot:10467190-Alexandrium_andersonii.AAC.1